MALISTTKAQKEARLEYLTDYLERNGYQIVENDNLPRSIQRLIEETIKLQDELAEPVNLYNVLVKLEENKELYSIGMEFDGMFCRHPHFDSGAGDDDTALSGTIDEEDYFYFNKTDLLASTCAGGVFTVNGAEIALFTVEQVLKF